MLADSEMMDYIESDLKKNGTYEEFEKECGKIKGRMMITRGDFPDGLDVKYDTSGLTVFEATFDFYNTKICAAANLKTLEIVGDLWEVSQVTGAATPSREWIDFFIKQIAEYIFASIKVDGTYGYPLYSWVNDTADMTMVPVKEGTV